ncbi:MAG: DUF6635 family protein [Pseudobdellovibrionaceae bacterium]
MNPEIYQSLQRALDHYVDSRKKVIPEFLERRLSLRECFEIQKKFLWKDLIRNPLNAVWAIPALSIRKAIEVADKLGWEPAKAFLPKIPQAFRTDFQKELEKILATDLLGLSPEPGAKSQWIRELEKEAAIKKAFGAQWDSFLLLLENEIRSEIHEQSVKHTHFTDLVSSTGILLVADQMFGDRSLDIFGIGKKIASLWAQRDAEKSFFLGKSLGKAFYKVAPAPPPTNLQIFFATGLAILALALVSTLIGVLSHPLQKKLGFRQKQLETMVDNVGHRLFLCMNRSLKKLKATGEIGKLAL